MPINFEQIQSLRHVFGDGEELVVVEKLINFLDGYAETNHISLQLVRQLVPGAGAGGMDKAILRALQFLSGDSVHVLEMKFEIYGLIDEAVHDITEEEANIALHQKIDPLTGEHDPAIDQRVGIYFAPVQGDVSTERPQANG